MVLLGVTFAAFFLTAMRVTTRAREVKVPDVRGKSVNAATAALADEGLVLKIELARPDATVPPDHVFSQDPGPGTVLRRERAVRVRVSQGVVSPALPALVGQPVRTAELMLSQAQIGVDNEAEIHTASYPADTVVAEDPPAKDQATKVALLVNRGDGDVTFVMPDVIGTLALRSVEILRRHAFRVTVAAEVPYPGLPPGVIVKQTPQAGFEIAYGDPVQLEVSR
jgi:serine/threonine-protein kinase